MPNCAGNATTEIYGMSEGDRRKNVEGNGVKKIGKNVVLFKNTISDYWVITLYLDLPRSCQPTVHSGNHFVQLATSCVVLLHVLR